MLDLVIKGAVVHGQHDGPGRVADVGVEGGLIVEVAPSIGRPARQEVAAEGMRLLPGAVDGHVHLRSPGHPDKEDWATGTRAAAAGGVTTVLDMPNTSPPTVDVATLAEKRDLARAGARVHFGLYLGATSSNLDAVCRLEDRGEAPVAVKAYLGASTGSLLFDDPAQLDTWLRSTRTLLAVHAEDERMLQRAAGAGDVDDVGAHGLRRPPEAATAAVAVAMGLAMRYGHRLHVCHLSTAGELALLAEARPEGLITCEVTPHHLFLDESDMARLGSRGKMNPPLRSAEDRQALLCALRDGRIDALGTDHAPHTLAEKALGAYAPSGVPGLDTALRLLVREAEDGRLSWNRVAEVSAARPAALFGLVGKGRVAAGFDADLVLIRPGPRRALEAAELHTRCGWSPFEGWPLPPPPHLVWVAGRLVARDGRIVDDGVRGSEVRPVGLGHG